MMTPLDASHNFACLTVLGIQIVDVMLRDQRDTAFLRELYHLLHFFCVSLDKGVMGDFEEEVVLPEDTFPLGKRRLCSFFVAVSHKFHYVSVE